MRLKIYNANDFNVKLKSTIHSTGKLGFTEATAKFMKLEVGAGVKFASDDEDESMLYLMYCKEFEDGAFKVAKSGNYFYNEPVEWQGKTRGYHEGKKIYGRNARPVRSASACRLR